MPQPGPGLSVPSPQRQCLTIASHGLIEPVDVFKNNAQIAIYDRIPRIDRQGFSVSFLSFIQTSQGFIRIPQIAVQLSVPRREGDSFLHRFYRINNSSNLIVNSSQGFQTKGMLRKTLDHGLSHKLRLSILLRTKQGNKGVNLLLTRRNRLTPLTGNFCFLLTHRVNREALGH
ncbi:hypothetical protein D3C78_946260 [compost metagenome]